MEFASFVLSAIIVVELVDNTLNSYGIFTVVLKANCYFKLGFQISAPHAISDNHWRELPLE